MPFLCQTLLVEYKFQDGDTWAQLLHGVPYDIPNLKDAIEWAKGYMVLPESCNHYDLDYRDFIRWCAREIRGQLGRSNGVADEDDD